MSPKVTESYKADLRGRILQAAVECISKAGYDRTRMDNIADAASISKGTIYLYFRSKEDLFNSLCQNSVDRVRMNLSEVFASEGSLTDKVSILYNKLREADAGSEALYLEMTAESTRNKRLKKILVLSQEALHKVVTEFLNDLFKRGLLIKGINLDALAAGYIALYNGLTMNAALGVPDLVIKNAWDETTRAIIESTGSAIKRSIRA